MSAPPGRLSHEWALLCTRRSWAEKQEWKRCKTITEAKSASEGGGAERGDAGRPGALETSPPAPWERGRQSLGAASTCPLHFHLSPSPNFQKNVVVSVQLGRVGSLDQS